MASFRRTAFCQSISEIQLTDVTPLGAVSHRFNSIPCISQMRVIINFSLYYNLKMILLIYLVAILEAIRNFISPGLVIRITYDITGFALNFYPLNEFYKNQPFAHLLALFAQSNSTVLRAILFLPDQPVVTRHAGYWRTEFKYWERHNFSL